MSEQKRRDWRQSVREWIQRPRARAEPVADSQTAWLCSPDAYRILVSGYQRLSDCPEVCMCVNVYADLISAMTIHLMRNAESGDARVINALSRRVDINPNPLMTRKTLISHIVSVLMLEGDGNQVTYPLYRDGLLESLQPLKPSLVKLESREDGYRIKYGSTSFQPDEVLHFVINPDSEKPWMGTGYRAVLKDIVKGLKQAGATKQAMLESPTPSLIVKVDGLTEEFASLDGRRKLRAQYLDSSENGEPWFIPAEAFSVEQVKPLTLNDLAIDKNLELDKRTAAAIFRVPAFLVGVGEYKKDEYNAFINHAIMPMAQAIQQELTRKLLYSPDLYWRFNPRSLYAYDINEIIQAGGEMVDRAAMTRNEWRDWVGMGPREDMEEIVLLENYLPIDKLGDQKKLIGGEENAST
ncbi:MAG: phage portal protein [Clostridiales bacterium]|nr:phage portal protein [Clostridiales bacterium]